MHRTLITPWKPSKTEILAARDKRISDLLAKDLIVLFAGINPRLVHRRHRPPLRPT